MTSALLGEGCDSVAVDINGTHVFRFPKSRDVEQQYVIESQILPVLARSAPVLIPKICFLGVPTSAFPRYFIGYRKLPGRPAIGVDVGAGPPLHLAPALAAFLSWLHAFPLEIAEAYGVPRQPLDSSLAEVRADALDDLAAVAEIAPDAPIDAVRRFLQAPPPPSAASAVLAHNDFAAEHVLVNDDATAITGVIDWSDIAISEAAADFAGLFHWGGAALADAVLASYTGRVDEHMLARATFLAVCRGVMDIAFGRQFARPEYVRSGLRALRLCQNLAIGEP